MSVPFTRTLPYVLREKLRSADAGLQLQVGKVVSVPDSRHVVVLLNGANVTVPKLNSYAPVANEAVYLLVGPSLFLAIGTVK